MRKSLVALFVLLIVSLVVTSCGPAVKSAATTTEGGEVFNVALPRIIIDLDKNGVPSIEGISTTDLASLGVNFSQRVDPFYVNWMTNANIQHVEVRQAGNGLLLLVNGELMPFLGWSDQSLQQASMTAQVLTVLFSQTVAGQQVAFTPNTAQSYTSSIGLIGKFLPIVRRLGLDLVVRFPRQAGAQEIALSDPTKMADPKPVASGQPASYVVQFEMKYDKNGMPAVLGITPAELLSYGISLGPTNLSPDAVKTLQRYNVQNIELRGKEDGLYVYVNGVALPNIAWDNSMIANVAQVYGQMNDQTIPLVQNIATKIIPQANKADLAVLIHLPVGQGQAVIPAKIH